MNESTEALIEKLTTFVEHTGTFTAEQMPIVAQEIITRGYISGVWAIILAVVAIIAFAGLAKFSQKKAENNDGWNVILAICIGMLFINTLVIFCNIYILLVVTFCPRLFVLEKLSELLT